jgi:hypothetical protein
MQLSCLPQRDIDHQAGRGPVQTWQMSTKSREYLFSASVRDALNTGYGNLEVRCLGCNTHQTVALDIVRRPKTTPVHERERYMRWKDCSRVSRYAFRRSQLIALRTRFRQMVLPLRCG